MQTKDWLYGFFKLVSMTSIVIGLHFFMSEQVSYLNGSVLLVVGFVSLIISNAMHSELSECFYKIDSVVKHPLHIIFWVSYGVVVLDLYRFIGGYAQNSTVLVVGSFVVLVSGSLLLRLCIKAVK